MPPTKRTNFGKGFALGAALVAFTTAATIITGDKTPTLANVGWWIDTFAQLAIGGIIVGAIVSWFGR